jgi:hypothetical protein
MLSRSAKFGQKQSFEVGSENILMQPSRKTYIAVIWETPTSVGKRVTVVAESLDDALLKLEEEFGRGKVFICTMKLTLQCRDESCLLQVESYRSRQAGNGKKRSFEDVIRHRATSDTR